MWVLINKYYGKEKETIHKASVRDLQRDKLFHPQIKIGGGNQTILEKILQNLQEAHTAQRRKKIVLYFLLNLNRGFILG